MRTTGLKTIYLTIPELKEAESEIICVTDKETKN